MPAAVSAEAEESVLASSPVPDEALVAEEEAEEKDEEEEEINPV